jgi:hypothetical protein
LDRVCWANGWARHAVAQNPAPPGRDADRSSDGGF